MADERIMNCNDVLPQNTEEACKLKQFQRLNFFNGMLMTASDFELWQRNIEEKRHLINRLVHGSGVVCGLEVKKIDKKNEECFCDPSGVPTMVADRWLVTLTAGVAIDCIGREIVVSNKEGNYFVVEKPPVEELVKNKEYFGLYIRRKDKLKHPVPTAADASCSEEMCCYSHIEENFELVFDKLIQTPRLAFDRLSYRPDEHGMIQFSIYLFEPYSDDTSDREVLIQSSEHRITEHLKRMPESDDLKVNIFFKDNLSIIAKGSKEITAEHEGINGEKYTRRAYVREEREFNKKFEKKRIGDEYYRIWLDECSCCDDVGDPKVLLAVLGPKDDTDVEIPQIEVKDIPGVWHRDIVYNNKMLYDLISCHLVDLERPPSPGSYVESGVCEITERNFTVDYFNIREPHTFIVSDPIKYSKPNPPKIPAIILGVEYEKENVSQISNMENLLPIEILRKIAPVNRNAEIHDIRYNQEPDHRLLFFKAINVNSESFHIAVINPSNIRIRGEKPLPVIHWWAIFDSLPVMMPPP